MLLGGLLLGQPSVLAEVREPGGEILNARADGLAPQQLPTALLQGEEVQKHLQSHAVVHIAVVKILFAGLVVHNPDIALPACVPGVHPVHEAPEPGLHLLTGDGHGGQVAVGAEVQLEGHGLEGRFGQLAP